MIILAFIFGVLATLFPLCIITHRKNNVHFYVARHKNGALWLYLGKPIREQDIFNENIHGRIMFRGRRFKDIGLNVKDYKELKWEDEPIEVFVNIKD